MASAVTLGLVVQSTRYVCARAHVSVFVVGTRPSAASTQVAGPGGRGN